MREALTRQQRVEISTQLFQSAEDGIAGFADSHEMRADVAVGYAHGLGWTLTKYGETDDGTPVMLVELDDTPIADVH